MANHGAGNKFASVNLNKSYGSYSGSSNSGTYGARVRSGGQIGGGMVVLSRPRSSQKIGQKLSVPSPVNLPSIRKEHEKFDSSGGGGVSAGGSSRPSSAGMGWTKPAVAVVQEKSSETLSDVVGGSMSSVEGASKVGSVYMPPVRSGSSADTANSSQPRSYTPVEKVAILRGEDFPSLHTSLSTSSGPKQKDGANQKSKQLPAGDLSGDHMDTNSTGAVDMHPQGRTLQHNMGHGSSGNDVGGLHLSGQISAEESQKQESYLHGTLPEVRLNPRSDWADDERDTGQVFTDRSRNHGNLNNDGYWDRDFEMPRGSFMPPKPANNVFNKWGQRDSETGKMLSSEVYKADPYNRDVRPTSREGRDRNSWSNSESHGVVRGISSWRSSSASSIRAKPQEHMNTSIQTSNENRLVAPSTLDRNNPSSIEGGRQQWTKNAEPSAVQGTDRHRNSGYQNGSPAKSTFSLGDKGLVNDPILNFNKVKKPLSNTDNLYLEDPFNANGYDGRDPFSGGLVGVVKRKKDVPKLTELHDPARESFEAELERVQKMQEQERQRAIEEQERAMHLARIEEEERLRLAQEHEEINRRFEEEAREAAWRAEQEQLQAIQKAEELRIAREEEKQRMQLEEERRKLAAKQKLLELEERIARRQAEAMREESAHAVNSISTPDKERGTSRAANISDWEDGERMVERITTSASSDSSGLNRFADSSPGLHSSADNSTTPGWDRSTNLQKRDAYESEGSSNYTLRNQESTPGRDFPFHARKSVTRKDVYGGSDIMYPPNYTNARVCDPDMNDPFQNRGQKWSFPGGSIPEIDAEMHERFPERLGQAAWRGGSSSHPTHSTYQERPYQNLELGEVYSYSRSRYSMRQPRVLPPPSISMNRTLNRGETERPALSASLDREVDNNFVRDSGLQTGYDNVRHENLVNPELVAFRPEHAEDQLREGNDSIRCDSQSSLSVTSPPSSPAYLSHEDVEDSRGTPGSSADEAPKVVRSLRNDPAVEEEEWIVENRKNLQQQEVYDEGGEYQERGEVHAEDAADIDLNEDFGALALEGKDSPCVSENLILGFNEGVEVGMPSDDSESNQNENINFSAPLSINDADSLQTDGHNKAQSAQIIDERAGDLAVHLNDDPSTSIGLMEVAASSGKPLRIFATDPVSETVASSVTAANHPEVPVKLQFGLFSGPSLIPLPVPSIQIGTIQMPLHLHPPVGSSLPHHSGPLFHFGQLRHNTPISQGALSLAPQAVSFAQPTLPGQSANHNLVGSMPVQPLQQSSQPHMDNRDALANNRDSHCKTNSSSIENAGDNNTVDTNNRLGLDVKISHLPNDLTPRDPSSLTDQCQVQSRVNLPHQFSRERITVRSKASGPVSSVRGRETVSNSKSFGARSSVAKFQRNGQLGGNQIQISTDRRIPSTNDKMNFGPRGARMSSRNGARRGVFSEKLANQTGESILPIPGIASTKDVASESKVDKGSGSNWSIAGHDTSRVEEICHKRNIEEDIDVTSRNGVVRVYDQPGIEVPCDEDDFIEVRSKRQMINDRREQREKDNKAKFRVTKNLQKPRFTSQTRAPRNSNKISSSFSGVPSHEAQPSFVANEDRSRVNAEATVRADSISPSQPLAPIGTPSSLSESCFMKRSQIKRPVQASRQPDILISGEVEPDSTNENRSKALENAEAPWDNVCVNQQVMPLTQSQLDDAMNPGRLDAHDSYSGKASGSIGLPVSSSSSLISDKSASPVNSLLAGKKIQFGAVTSPSVLPPSSRVVTHGRGSGRPDKLSHELSGSENVHSLFNVSEKHAIESSSHIAVSEAEVAGSAEAVATNDKLGTGAGRYVNVPASEGVKHSNNDGNIIDQKFSSQSRTEESLSVSLPADLSIEMSPISAWQPLQSPQSAPHHMLSHFPSGHPSHFPFYEMNPMVGRPVFAVGPSDNASGSETQSQNNSTIMPGPLGTWQQRHPVPDSFYGHHAGFPPFISQPGGIPGAQVPPHMVVYNHFAPVGQYGQVGLSFMGTTYVPSGKQPDWKHNPTSSAMAVGNENVSNMEMKSGQHIHHSTLAPGQHLAPGSSLLPLAPPLAMYDVSPFQQSSDMSGSARWSHVPPQHLHSMPQLQPLQPHSERLMHVQPSNGSPPPDTPAAPAALTNRFPDSQTASGNALTSSGLASQFPAELGLVEATSGSAPFDPSASKSSDTNVVPAKISLSQSGGSSQSITSMKNRSHQQKPAPFQQHNYSTGFNHHHHRAGTSQRNSSAGEWTPSRRAGYHSRNQSSSGNEKSFHHAKVKQIYVPKQPAAANATAPGTS